MSRHQPISPNGLTVRRSQKSVPHPQRCVAAEAVPEMAETIGDQVGEATSKVPRFTRDEMIDFAAESLAQLISRKGKRSR